MNKNVISKQSSSINQDLFAHNKMLKCHDASSFLVSLKPKCLPEKMISTSHHNYLPDNFNVFNNCLYFLQINRAFKYNLETNVLKDLKLDIKDNYQGFYAAHGYVA